MKKVGGPDGVDRRVLDQLRSYTALDNPIRLKAFRLIHDSPGVPFNEIAKYVRVDSGLLAYHMGVLKTAEIVDVTYGRQGRQVTSYRLSPRGKELFADLFAKAAAPSSRTAKTLVPATAR